MRNTILFLPVLLLGSAHAQSNFPFPDSAAQWVQSYYAMVQPPPFPVYELTAMANPQVNGEDTLINAISYSKVTDLVTGAYYGGVRDDAGRVWHVPVDSVQEYLLYDFTAQPGDTLLVIHYQMFPGPGSAPGFFAPVVQNVYADTAHEGRIAMDYRWRHALVGRYRLRVRLVR